MNHDTHFAIVSRLFPGAALESAERLAGGVSADVHRLDVRRADGTVARVVVRAHGASHAGHSAELEFQLLRALHEAGVPVPEPLLLDVGGGELGAPYIVMAFVDGSTAIPAPGEGPYIDAMARLLVDIHETPTTGLPTLPARNDPLPEVLDYLPEGAEWAALRDHLGSMENTTYTGPPRLLHGDFWPENLLWRDGEVIGVLDWEDAALGDPLSDLACSRLELRYRFGTAGKERFTRAYAGRRDVNDERLALWQVYVAAAAQRFMGQWGLPAAREAHMRSQALASIREAGAALMGPGR